jgi:tRNA pseudouridine55 synthase
MTAPFGFLNIDKPLGLTSHDVVSAVKRGVRRYGNTVRVGHAGTLDPLATGVLVVCVGGATRLAEYAMHAEKGYRATVRFGVVTDTYDAEGAIVRENDASHLTAEDVEAALAPFRGTLAQVPPMYSAIKQGGRKLYEIARAGEVVEREPRTVVITALTLREWRPPLAVLDVACSAGTYIRSLAYDLGEALGVGASLAGLVRTKSGAFRLESALTLEAAAADPAAHLIAPGDALAHMPRLTLQPADHDAVAHGRAALGAETAAPGTLALAYTESGELIAIVRAVGELWQPEKVFSPA